MPADPKPLPLPACANPDTLADEGLPERHKVLDRVFMFGAWLAALLGRGAIVWCAWRWFLGPHLGLPDLTAGLSLGIAWLLNALRPGERDRWAMPGSAGRVAYSWLRVAALGVIFATVSVIYAVGTL